MSDSRVDHVARTRGPHLYAQRHTAAGAAAWAAWRLEVAGVLRAADRLAGAPADPTPGVVDQPTVRAIAEAFVEVGDREAAGFVLDVFGPDGIRSTPEPGGPPEAPARSPWVDYALAREGGRVVVGPWRPR